MEKIRFDNVIPNVFAHRNDIFSDIWLKEVEFVKGQKYLIEANSGTGKSSLGSFIFGYRDDYDGTITFDNVDIHSFTKKKWCDFRRKQIAFLWQELRLFPELTALENVTIKNQITGEQRKKVILEWFDMLGIGDKTQSLVGKMSYGQQQRVALIRALCQPYDFIFVDEPVSHLDDSNADLIGQLLAMEAERNGAGIIVTSIGKRMHMNYDKIFRL